jgi:hypothetical protein
MSMAVQVNRCPMAWIESVHSKGYKAFNGPDERYPIASWEIKSTKSPIGENCIP